MVPEIPLRGVANGRAELAAPRHEPRVRDDGRSVQVGVQMHEWTNQC